MYNALLVGLIILVVIMLGAIIFAFVRIQKLFYDIQLVNERIDFIVRYSQMTDAERESMRIIVDQNLNAYRHF